MVDKYMYLSVIFKNLMFSQLPVLLTSFSSHVYISVSCLIEFFYSSFVFTLNEYIYLLNILNNVNTLIHPQYFLQLDIPELFFACKCNENKPP